MDKKPLCVLEQAVEAGTPQTLSTEAAFRQSAAYARKTFQVLA